MYTTRYKIKNYEAFIQNYQVVGKDENDVWLCWFRRVRTEKGENDESNQHCNNQRDESGYDSISCFNCFVFHHRSICWGHRLQMRMQTGFGVVCRACDFEKIHNTAVIDKTREMIWFQL